MPQGTIRFALGLAMTMGACGGITDPANPILLNIVVGTVGILLLRSGGNELKKAENAKYR